MKGTDLRTAQIRSNRTIWMAIAAVLAIAAIIFVMVKRNRPPQMGVDDAAFHTVDALYTAICNRDEPRMNDCEQRLHSLRDEGKLPKSAAEHLDGIIAKARSGEWEAAAKRLYDFMLAQRRDKAIQ